LCVIYQSTGNIIELSGLEFKRPSNRNCLPSMTKQKQMLRKFFDVAGQVRLCFQLAKHSCGFARGQQWVK